MCYHGGVPVAMVTITLITSQGQTCSSQLLSPAVLPDLAQTRYCWHVKECAWPGPVHNISNDPQAFLLFSWAHRALCRLRFHLPTRGQKQNMTLKCINYVADSGVRMA